MHKLIIKKYKRNFYLNNLKLFLNKLFYKNLIFINKKWVSFYMDNNKEFLNF